MRRSTQIQGVVILVLLVGVLAISYAAAREDHRGTLTISFLNVGEGNATFIEAPSGRQVLIDGGPDASVLRQLGSAMPWYDHSIDIVVSTSPDADDATGLVDVLERYDISYILRSSVESTAPIWRAFKNAVAADEKKGTKTVIAQRGQILDLGSGAYIEILSPDRNVAGSTAAEGCVVARVVYGATAFMLPCDASQGVEKYLAMLDGSTSLTAGGDHLKADVLEAGHQGAKTSSSPIFVGYVAPAYAVYSHGCNDKSGNPAGDTVATFAKFKVATFDTCADGTVTFVSDGQTARYK